MSDVDLIESYQSQGKVNWESSIYSLVLVLLLCHLLFSQPLSDDNDTSVAQMKGGIMGIS